MAELLYPDMRVDRRCETCGDTFRCPTWAQTTQCTSCGPYVVYGADEHSPIVSCGGVEIVAQKWGGHMYLGTRQFDPERTVDIKPDEDLGAHEYGVFVKNHAILVSDNEARVYAERILALLGEEVS